MTTRQKPLIDDFLQQERIAVVGLSRNRLVPANAILAKLIRAGYTAWPVHPQAEAFEGQACAPTLADLPDTPDGVVLATRPEVTASLVDECIRLGIPRIWMHNMMGNCTRVGRGHAAQNTSVAPEAAERARAAGVAVITGSCPNQYVPPLDAMHRGLYWFNRIVGNTR